jgi:Predicted Zn-dependent proteases and their inactivated homologs
VTRLLRVFSLALVATLCFAQSPALLTILSDELNRNFQSLKEKGDPPPYFMAYEVTEEEACTVQATLGALQASMCGHTRQLDVTIRVGSPQLDNYHRVEGERPVFTSAARLPLEDVAAAIRQIVWRETDRVYRMAAERLIKLKTSTQVQVASEDKSADFTVEKPSIFSEATRPANFLLKPWEERVLRWSAVFSDKPGGLTSDAGVLLQRQTKYLVSTEGTRLVHGRGFARIAISAETRAMDGMDLGTSETFEAEDPSGLPDDKTVLSAAERVGKQLESLKIAPLAEPFVGPAILSGRAAGVFFHEIFGHRVEGHRQKDEAEGQTFTKSIGLPVLPTFLSIYFDPSLRKAAGVDLNGSYRYDDEGMPGQRLTLVDKGVLRTFLMSRSPVLQFDKSNGHGRRQPGFEVVSRQSNLIVESANAVDDARLREMLREEIRRQNKPYGLYFEQVTGGYTQTRRSGLQAFAVLPLVVYKVYPDNRPDELVRGVDIVGTPLASFSKILATSNRPEVFNGYCGAESGSVPVSAVSPALLVSEIETQRKEKSTDRPPLLPRPIPAAGQ